MLQRPLTFLIFFFQVGGSTELKAAAGEATGLRGNRQLQRWRQRELCVFLLNCSYWEDLMSLLIYQPSPVCSINKYTQTHSRRSSTWEGTGISLWLTFPFRSIFLCYSPLESHFTFTLPLFIPFVESRAFRLKIYKKNKNTFYKMMSFKE